MNQIEVILSEVKRGNVGVFEAAHEICSALFKGDEKGLLTPRQTKDAINVEFEKHKEHYDFAGIESGSALRHFVAHYPGNVYMAIKKAQQIVTRQERDDCAEGFISTHEKATGKLMGRIVKLGQEILAYKENRKLLLAKSEALTDALKVKILRGK